VSPRVRYVLLTAARTRAPMIPLAVSLLALIGTYAYRRNELGPTWGLTALLCCALGAWLVGAVLAGEPPAQAEMATAALGGRRERTGLDVLLVLLVALALAALFLAYPLLLDAALGGAPLLEPAPRVVDVAAAAAGQLFSAGLGGAIAVLYAPPRVARRATTAAAVLATLVALVAVSGPLGPVGGPAAVADALGPGRPAAAAGGLALACLSCAALAAAAVAGGDWWAPRSG
jgi:hypothetical protein